MPDCGYAVDIRLNDDFQDKDSLVVGKLIIEVQGPYHYFRELDTMLPRNLMKFRHLKALGYHLAYVELPHKQEYHANRPKEIGYEMVEENVIKQLQTIFSKYTKVVPTQ